MINASARSCGRYACRGGGARPIAAAIDVRLELVPYWRGGDLDRTMNARHAAMHEEFARFFSSLPEWRYAPEVSFSVHGERGSIDGLGWHPARKALLVVELKSGMVDIQDLIGTLDRKRRLARKVGEARGWTGRHASAWVVIAEGPTNRRRLAEHESVLRLAFPTDGRGMRQWLRDPAESVAGLSFLSYSRPGQARRSLAATKRVRQVGARSTGAG